MNIFSVFLLIISIIFTAYKLILSIIRHIKKTHNKSFDIKLVNCDFDKRFHSSPSFDFPNIQSESDLRILNSGSDPCDKQEEIQVKQYCRY